MKCEHNRMFWLLYPGEVCNKCKLLPSYKQFTEEPQNLPKADAYSLLAEVIPIEEWGDRTGLKQALETHRDYGDDIVRLALITFRQYLRDNFI